MLLLLFNSGPAFLVGPLGAIYAFNDLDTTEGTSTLGITYEVEDLGASADHQDPGVAATSSPLGVTHRLKGGI